MKLFLKILLGLVVVLVLGAGFWTYDHKNREHRATEQALAALESDAAVTVSQDEWIVFSPATATPTKGVIFYPGGECDERGYAEPLREIAADGYLVVLVPMPMQMAFMGLDKATEVIAAFPEIESWAIAGHSLGGSMAARYAFHHPENVQGLIMWDAYPADDMSASTLPVAMIHRSNQAGDPPEDYAPQLDRLPPQTQFIPLKGGQHLNFGGFIAGRMYADAPPPELEPEIQRSLAVKYTGDFMQEL
jgi:hypothetical protein